MDIALGGASLTRNWSDEELRGLSIELSAFDGQISTSTIPVPDPTGADEVPPGRSVRVDEGTTRLLDGIIVQEGRSRGFEPTNPNKKDDYTVEDPNTFLYGFRVIADRPEESDYARIQWFFDTYLPASDTTFVLNTFTTTMVAAEYKSDGVADIMRDAIDITGKTLFVHDKAAGGICAHWHALTAGHTCGLTIDDSDPSVNGPTSWLPQNPSRVRDGHDLTNDYSAYGSDGIGPVDVSDGTSIAAYDVDGKLHQAFANFPEATDIATLTADANRILETNKDPRDTWTCTIGPLDETALALIRVGDIIPCTSTVMTLSASPQRIASLRLTVAGGQRVAPTLWMAELTLGAPVRGPGGRPSGMVRPPSNQLPGTYVPFVLNQDDSYSVVYGSTDDDCAGGVDTGLSIIRSFSVDAPLVGLGCQVIPNTWRMGQQLDDPDPDLLHFFTDRVFINNSEGRFTGTLYLTAIKVTATSVAPDPSSIRMRQASWPDGLVYAGTTFSGDAFHDLNGNATIAYGADPDVALSYSAIYGPSYGFTGGGYYYWTTGVQIPIAGYKQFMLDSPDQELFWIGVNTAAMDSENEDPPAGHPVALTTIGTADGTTADWSTLGPYRPGTLVVYVGGLPWAADGYIETDPSTGAFTFTQIPIEGDTPEDNLIQVTYVSA